MPSEYVKQAARQMLVQLPSDKKEALEILGYVRDLVDAADAVFQDRRPDLRVVREGGSGAASRPR